MNRMTIALKTTKEMNLTPILLTMAVTVVTATMKCTPDHPKHRYMIWPTVNK